ncbi:energy-coupled thiamine transporter ThiT [Kroppenstedtia pulmonis]|uniref:Energy-coupled thiamine transporter ThiT n=1 Tax=Kroppenstedtia pulmonis TaxID=1380685 RepID=A0A7D3XMY8_9BACL|nr:energy-coupled thiamine transporter ThiT [Kroppenstedtia pulmonis]QKG84669.1 energy-coupled thiamine transporter ThiT [Kroppenstedtia pulmonis]
MERQRLKIMMEIAVMAGVGGILSTITPFRLWAYGGSVSLAMVPIVIIAFRRGLVAGVTSGLLVGLINFLMNPTITHPIQVVLDYPVAYAALGMAGIVTITDQTENKVKITNMAWAIALGGFLRLTAHFISGVVWFGAYAPEAFSPVLYSFLYNISYIFPDVLISILVMAVLIVKAPHLVMVRR